MPTINYIYHGNQYLCETDENDTPTNLYVSQPGAYTNLVSQKDLSTGKKSYPLYDAVGSTRAVTDENGDVADTFVYDAWGNVVDRTGTTEIPFQYVGKYGYYRDELLNTYYVTARTFSPRTIRWNSQDPMKFFDGMNNYIYSLNDPTNFIDVTGTSPFCTLLSFAIYRPPWRYALIHYSKTSAVHIGVPFFVTAEFGGDCCDCCEYRQFISMDLYVNGQVLRDNYESIGQLPGIPDGGSTKPSGQDDGAGHRDNIGNSGWQVYCPCSFKLFDMPGWYNPDNYDLPKRMEELFRSGRRARVVVYVRVEFEISILDTCEEPPYELHKEKLRINEFIEINHNTQLVERYSRYPYGIVKCDPIPEQRVLPGQSIPIP